MPTKSMPESALASEDWELIEPGHRAGSLIVQLRRSTHVLSWLHFVYAKGNSSKLHLDFGEHTLAITGDGLDVLLEAVAQHRVIRLVQPMQNQAKFNMRESVSQAGRPVITQILVDPPEDDDDHEQEEAEE